MHYRTPDVTFPGERVSEIDHRWVERILATDQKRFGTALEVARPLADRVAGCCRDVTLLTVAALRQRGVPARSRVGFADYFEAGFHHDHVVAEYWDGERWVWVDAQLDPGPHWGFDTWDMPRPAVLPGPAHRPCGGFEQEPPFASAAAVWTALRRGEIDPRQYGVGPGVPIGGPWFIYNYVLLELAHRRRDELLLWDGWGAMSGDFAADLSTGDSEELALVDEIAALLLAADAGDPGTASTASTASAAAAERELAERYAADPRLQPGERVTCHSPTGEEFAVDLRKRESARIASRAEIAVGGLRV